jgi:alpha-tubulin suppressor-like RCC1 family protein
VTGIAGGVEVRCGLAHTCVLHATGAVSCWGSNAFGQLGDGTFVSSRLVPTLVVGLSDAVAVTGGATHSCARRASGAAVCWGNNGLGRLGDGTTVSSRTPVAVTGLTDAVEIAAGSSHTCVRHMSGAVSCWGDNASGQLGTAGAWSSMPLVVSGVTDAVQLSLGHAFTCLRHATGTLSCFGDNARGQLGDGTTTGRSAPEAVLGLASALEIAAGREHGCARTAGGAWCWGRNVEAQLADGTLVDRLTPVAVVRP